MSVEEDDGSLVVRSALPDSTAVEAGIEVGDEIREVAGDRVRSFEELRVSLEAIDSDTEYERSCETVTNAR